MNESQFYQKLKKNLPQVHWNRIENSIGSGMFDVNGCYEGRDVWVELKERYKNGKVLLRPSQHAWAFQRHKVNGNIWVLAFEKNSTCMYLYHPPFKVTPYQRWLELDASQPAIVCANWQSVLMTLFCFKLTSDTVQSIHITTP